MNKISIVIFLEMVLLISCNQKTGTATIANATDSTSTKKASVMACEKSGSVCKMPSRSVALPAVQNSITTADSSWDEMVKIPGGTFQMGSNDFEDSKPVHNVSVKAFLRDEHEVTNARFQKFVRATNYMRVVERQLNPEDYPGLNADKLVPGSAVFTPPAHPVPLQDPAA